MMHNDANERASFGKSSISLIAKLATVWDMSNFKAKFLCEETGMKSDRCNIVRIINVINVN